MKSRSIPISVFFHSFKIKIFINHLYSPFFIVYHAGGAFCHPSDFGNSFVGGWYLNTSRWLRLSISFLIASCHFVSPASLSILSALAAVFGILIPDFSLFSFSIQHWFRDAPLRLNCRALSLRLNLDCSEDHIKDVFWFSVGDFQVG